MSATMKQQKPTKRVSRPAASEASKSNRVIIFDTTMRDGEQAPGASMSLEEKLELAKILEELGVDVIEAGFPIASNGDFEAVREVSKIVTESTIAGLCRANLVDIDRCAEAIRHASIAAPFVHADALAPHPARSICESLQ